MTTQFAGKLEIFVGATRRDLGPARQAVINAILMKGHIPSGMELWAAGNKPPLEVIARYLERCDAHIMLVGARYGSPIEGADGIGFTEWEYQQSKDKRPILPFLFDRESLRRARRNEKEASEKKRETRNKLDRLRSELHKTKYVKEFRNDAKGLGELQKEAILAIDELLQSDDVPLNAGWIRGDSAEARTARDIAGNTFLQRELDQLRRFSTLGGRVGVDVASKEASARTFWWNMQGRIRRHRYFNLFFESGSTIAYLSDEFVRIVLLHGQDALGWHIHTNNVLSLVYFDLHTSIDASRFPTGTPDPDDEYGAIFPGEWKMLHEPPPRRPRKLYPKEKAAVDAMRSAFNGACRRQLVLATASGLDLDNRVMNFRGPHVGSHPNMLFKRAIFTSGNPVVLFISAEKLGDPFRRGICYSVFDPDDPWKDAVSKYPMAICVGHEYPKRSKSAPRISTAEVEQRNDALYIRDSLNKLGFHTDYFEENSPSGVLRKPGTGAMLYANEKFKKLIPND
jgi:hypothetical protein